MRPTGTTYALRLRQWIVPIVPVSISTKARETRGDEDRISWSAMPDEGQGIGEYGQPVCPVCSRTVSSGITAVRLNSNAWVHIGCLDQAPIDLKNPQDPKNAKDSKDAKDTKDTKPRQ
jgi:hypothetical protein